MLTAVQRARLTVVLVGARNPQNIGAAARAMHDFGFSDLRIVNPFAAPFEAAVLEATSAVAAQTVMQKARRYETLADAIADCTLVVATTAVGEREMTQPVLPLQESAPAMLAHLVADAAAATRVALLFGSEKTGLTTEQLSYATLLTTIPMYQPEGARHLSMNLGQSVAVCLYELARDGLEDARAIPTLQEAAATAADRERLTELLLDAMQRSGYSRRFPANAAAAVVRQLVQQLGATHREAMTWMGILKQMVYDRKG